MPFFNRRRFLMSTAIASAVLSLPAMAMPAGGVVHQVSTDLLDIGYYEAGPEAGRPILLLHGADGDLERFAGVVPQLVAQGFRVIVPFLRGHGTTTPLDKAAPVSTQEVVLGQDVLDLMNALHIPEAVLAGFDLGGHAVTAAATLRPSRCVALVTVNSAPQPALAEVLVQMVRMGKWRT
ncbi:MULTISPECIES: alpha/beta fold hydrolase [unclassified Pseudomonas]|uniref:alpha/beta fold hydrolase n=1 Tax=unclassified Pseudomonas TaxID=196821 RepID=UPI0015A1B6E7|nr:MULTISPECIES: alpha/beta fold hydrolase [unclassified Pseudomonas]NWC95850.1 alpha/beta fold hydrolase [Pseudomonas sp. IPO3779]NWD20163.1 alpha/beta fold hydrolase [Pseudomonas sp. IPO3778]